MRETPDASTRGRLLGLVMLALPVGASLGLVIAFGVDVPQQDCWDTPGDLLERWVLGEARWFDVIGPCPSCRLPLASSGGAHLRQTGRFRRCGPR